MNKFLLFLIVCVLLSSCSPVKNNIDPIQSPNLQPDSESTSHEINHSAGSAQMIAVNENNVEKLFAAALLNSSFVIEGTLSSVEEIPWDASIVGGQTWKACTFENITVITGCFTDDKLILQDPKPEGITPFEIGERYFLVVYSYNTVYTPEEDVAYQGSQVRCKISKEDPNRIDYLEVCGYMTDLFQTRWQFVEYVDNIIGIGGHYYNRKDYYVHSDNIDKIVDLAPVVVKVMVNNIDGDPNAYANHCTCMVLDVHKGRTHVKEGSEISFSFCTGSVENGKMYIVMIQKRVNKIGKDGRPQYINNPDYQIVSKQNSVIPLTDTDRVQQVYDALGIQPES